MQIVRILSFLPLLPVSIAFAQEPANLFDQPPAGVEDALKTRVMKFYQAHIDGKFRLADQYVAEEAKDDFFAADKVQWESCQFIKATYSENFTKAAVVTACRTELRFRGHKMPTTAPLTTHWEVVNGEWYWYLLHAAKTDTPFGPMEGGPDSSGPVVSAIPKDPEQAAREILASVKVEPTSLAIDPSKSTRQEVHIRNGMMGNISISVDNTGLPGLTIKAPTSPIGQGQEAVVVFDYNAESPDIQCKDCLAHPQLRQTVTAKIHVDPTGQIFPIDLVFLKPAAK
ncbi:MAG TPA: hypothetical protein VKU01_17195 [Bryobacteraceae bacterium]|nr:hypothetical protein [Bryobacteraceae bacterium]